MSRTDASGAVEYGVCMEEQDVGHGELPEYAAVPQSYGVRPFSSTSFVVY